MNANSRERLIGLLTLPTGVMVERLSANEGRNKMVHNFLEPFLDLCVSSLREGHANLLCIVPILTDVTEVIMYSSECLFWKHVT